MYKHLTRLAAAALIASTLLAGSSCAGTASLAVTSLSVSGGPRCGYQNVTIDGSGFEHVTSVTFGLTEALGFTVADATRIVVKTPAGQLGQTVDVTVTTSQATVSLPDAYTYFDYDLRLVKGKKTVAYTLDQIQAMSPITGFWGGINDRPFNTDQYRGVPLLELLKAVGGWSPGEQIVAQSADGFLTTYTTEMLTQMADGSYPMWGLAGTQIVTDDRVAQLLLAYDIDTACDGSSWESFKAGKGPFRIVTMSAQSDRLSPAPPNPFLVTSVEIKAEQPATGTGTGTATTVSDATTTESTNGSSAEEAPSGLTVSSLNVSSGPRCGHQNVTIHGSGFSGVTGVMFGTAKVLSFNVADPTQIVVQTPTSELGQVIDVTVATVQGSKTLPRAYTYLDYDFKVTKGSKTAIYTLDQLKKLPAVTGYWGAHKGDAPYPVDKYRGVALLTLLKAVGGLNAEEQIAVQSADGFTAVYAPELLDQMNKGTYPMWNVNGTQIVTDDRVAQAIVAYEIDTKADGSGWEPLEAGTGPLRIVLITKKSDRVSQGKFNPFLTVSAEITNP